jgi:retinol dehydrogenase 12
MRELTARLSSSEDIGARVVINAVDPGICRTNLTREFTGLNYYIARGLSTVLGRTAEVGSRTIVFASDSGMETHGRYIGSCKVVK